MRLPVCLALVVCVSMVGWAQTPAPGPIQGRSGIRPPAATAAAQTRLAVRRVVLYKNGVGFFEHVGRVTGDQDVTVTFTSAQLDDALKSLTALDLGRGRVAGITYNSTAPLPQRLAGLPFTLGDKADLMEFFRSVRGARLEVRQAGAVVRGRLASAEPVAPAYGSAVETTTMLTLVGDHGEVRAIRLDRRASVRLVDDEVSSGVTRYLSLVAEDLRRDERRVTVAARGVGSRESYVSYVAEVPVWKSTYRLLMPTEGRPAPLLQGWAVVDNTVGEDWRDVEMALVAGAPQSFVQRLSQPRYLPRAEVPVSLEANLTPMLHDAGVTGQFGTIRGVARDNHGTVLPGVNVTLELAGTAQFRAVTNSAGEFTMSARPGAYTLVFELAGFGSARRAVSVQAGQVAESNAALEVGQLTESITVTGAAPELDTGSTAFVVAAPDSRTVEEQMALELPQATGQPVGELFEYRISGPVTVRKNESALVPILRSEIAADRVSVWNDGLGTSRPLRAVWLTNTTGLTLDGGTMSNRGRRRVRRRGNHGGARARRPAPGLVRPRSQHGGSGDFRRRPAHFDRAGLGRRTHRRAARNLRTPYLHDAQRRPRRANRRDRASDPARLVTRRRFGARRVVPNRPPVPVGGGGG